MSLKHHTLTQAPVEPVISRVEQLMPTIETFSESELQELRHQIDQRLHLDLGSLDLAEELGLQFRQAKQLLNEIQNDKFIATNQKSQVFNSVRAITSDIVKQQEVVWSAERLKKIEIATIKALDTLPAEARSAFFSLYGKYLKDPNAPADTV